MPKSFDFGLSKVVPAKRETLLGYAHSAPVCARVSRVRAGVLCVSALEQGFPLRRCAWAPRFKRYFAAFCDDNASICVFFAPRWGGPFESCVAFLMFGVLFKIFCFMSKVTVSAILAVVRLVLNLISKAVRMIYTIIDLCDDGCINNSIPRPEWVSSLLSVIESLEAVGSEVTSVESRISCND